MLVVFGCGYLFFVLLDEFTFVFVVDCLLGCLLWVDCFDACLGLVAFKSLVVVLLMVRGCEVSLLCFVLLILLCFMAFGIACFLLFVIDLAYCVCLVC